MKALLTLLFGFLSVTYYSQSIEVRTEFDINKTVNDPTILPDLGIYLTKNQKNQILQKFINRKKQDINQGWIVESNPTYNLSNPTQLNQSNYEIIEDQLFVSRKTEPYQNSTKSIFKKDSVLLEYWLNENEKNPTEIYTKLDKSEQKIYSEYGFFSDVLKEITFSEKWKFEKNKLLKNGLVNSINISCKEEEKLGSWETFYETKTTSTDYELLKKDFTYQHIVYDWYYSRLIHEDSIFQKHDYGQALAVGLKQSSGFSEKEFDSFLQPIISAIYEGKINAYELDSFGKKTNEKMDISKFSELFEIKGELEEVLEDFNYPEDGEEIYLTQSIRTIYSNDIIGFEFTEDWYVAKELFYIKKEVKGMKLLYLDWDRETQKTVIKKIPAYISFE